MFKYIGAKCQNAVNFRLLVVVRYQTLISRWTRLRWHSTVFFATKHRDKFNAGRINYGRAATYCQTSKGRWWSIMDLLFELLGQWAHQQHHIYCTTVYLSWIMPYLGILCSFLIGPNVDGFCSDKWVITFCLMEGFESQLKNAILRSQGHKILKLMGEA